VEAYPDEIVRDLIAHEMAHVLQHARGLNMREADAYDIEVDADQLVDWWGFSSTSMDEWDLEHGVTRRIDPTKLSKRQWSRLRARARESGRGGGIFLLFPGPGTKARD
jgi:hypothetical protein